jgi:hypothetical protein
MTSLTSIPKLSLSILGIFQEKVGENSANSNGALGRVA